MTNAKRKRSETYARFGRTPEAKERQRKATEKYRSRKGQHVFNEEYAVSRVRRNGQKVFIERDVARSFYQYARELSKVTGVEHHVDHIFPLKSDWVCGLHVWWNMRVVPASQNQSKNNRKGAVHDLHALTPEGVHYVQ